MFNKNIIEMTKENLYFRQELITGTNSQLVLMSLLPGEEISEEVHDVDQILFFVEGQGQAVLNGETSEVKEGFVTFVPAGARHNFINTGVDDLKLYTVYAPAEHKPGTVHKTKAEAEKEHEA